MLAASVIFIACGFLVNHFVPELIIPLRVIITFTGQFLIFYTVMFLFKNVSQQKPEKAVFITLISIAAKLLLLLILLLFIYFIFKGLSKAFLIYFMLGYIVYTGIFVTYSLKIISNQDHTS